ncbi:winged helix-turn-helix domain-containing protein [Sulfuricurvum sp.]|uniref:winged helix-turn-helix domain-containing protein n=1 Tax=Sulfuricurvum sp. TaxID=2025608 RepID=UPI003447FA2F
MIAANGPIAFAISFAPWLKANEDAVRTCNILKRGSEENYKTETVNVAITRLKEKIDPEKRKNYIRTLRGVGYSLQ